jgi:hypothetical protein
MVFPMKSLFDEAIDFSDVGTIQLGASDLRRGVEDHPALALQATLQRGETVGFSATKL